MNASSPQTGIYIKHDGTYRDLADWLFWADQQIRVQAAAIESLTDQSAQLYSELASVRSELQQARILVAEPSVDSRVLQRRLDGIDQRLNRALARLDNEIGGGQSEQGMRHHSYAREYVSLVEQQVLSLTLTVFRSNNDATPKDKASLVAQICHILFGSSEPQESALAEALPADQPAKVLSQAARLVANARELRAKVGQGRSQRWEFSFAAGVEVDQERQELWPGSVDNGVVGFVVTPAYVVDTDTWLEKQRVFTVTVPPPT